MFCHALTSNEHQAKGEVPLEISDSCAGPVTAHVLTSSYRYSFLHCAPEYEASSSPDIACHPQDFLQPADNAGAGTISWRMRNSGNCSAEQPHLSASRQRHTALLSRRAKSGQGNEEQCTNCIGVLSHGMQKLSF